MKAWRKNTYTPGLTLLIFVFFVGGIFGIFGLPKSVNGFRLFAVIIFALSKTAFAVSLFILAAFTFRTIKDKHRDGKPFGLKICLLAAILTLVILSAAYLIMPSMATLKPLETLHIPSMLLAIFFIPIVLSLGAVAVIDMLFRRTAKTTFSLGLLISALVVSTAGLTMFTMHTVYWPGTLQSWHERPFDEAAWKSVDYQNIARINPRRMMLKDIMENVLPIATCEEMVETFGKPEFLSSKCEDRSQSHSSYYFYALGEKPGSFWMDRDYLEIKFNENGQYESHSIYNWD